MKMLLINLSQLYHFCLKYIFFPLIVSTASISAFFQMPWRWRWTWLGQFGLKFRFTQLQNGHKYEFKDIGKGFTTCFPFFSQNPFPLKVAPRTHTCVLLRLLSLIFLLCFVTFDTCALKDIDSFTTNIYILQEGVLLLSSLLQLVCFCFIESETVRKCMLLIRPSANCLLGLFAKSLASEINDSFISKILNYQYTCLSCKLNFYQLACNFIFFFFSFLG